MLKKISVIISSILVLFICIGTIQINKVDAESAHSHNGIIYDKTLSSALTQEIVVEGYYNLGSGNYYLDGDYTLDKKVVIGDGVTVNLCLNGNVLNLDQYKFEILSGGTLNIYSCDSTKNHYFNITEDPEDEFIDGLWRITDQETTNVIKGGVITNSETGSIISYAFENYGTMLFDSVNLVGINADLVPIINRNSDTKLNIYNSSFIGNRGDTGSGAIYALGKLNIYNSEFKYNKTTNFGGAIYFSNRTLIKDSVIENNEAYKGGAILNNQGILTLINTEITNNSATTEGGGVYSTSTSMCLKEGTKILMADGSLSNIEDVKENDYIKAFDHFSGELVNEKVFVAYRSEDKGNTYTLHFEDGNDLSIAGVHDLFSKKTMNYVEIYEVNAEEFIGDYFYDAVNKKWNKLVSVTYDKETSNYYSLYTEHCHNCIANNMLTVPDDGAGFLKIFKFDNELKVNQEELDKDIEKYGLYEFKEGGYITKEHYDACNVKYLNIVIGKGFATFEELIGYSEEAKEIKEKNNTLSIFDVFSSIFETNKVSADDEETCDTYADGKSSGDVILGSNVIIKNNKLNSVDENLYLRGNPLVYFINGTKDLDIGVTHSLGSAIFTGVNDTNYQKYFTSDSDLYKVIHNSENVLKLGRAYNFTALTSDTTKIYLDGVTIDKAKEISSFYLTIAEKVNGVVVAYEKDGDDYLTITYNGSDWEDTGSKSLSGLKAISNAYVIGLIEEDAKKLVHIDEEDCEVKADGKGYAEYTIGKGKDTIMHISGFVSSTDYNDLTVTCGNTYLKEDEYEVSDGSIKVKVLSSFINTLKVGTNVVKVEITKGSAKYQFELNIKINDETHISDYKVVKTSTK